MNANSMAVTVFYVVFTVIMLALAGATVIMMRHDNRRPPNSWDKRKRK